MNQWGVIWSVRDSFIAGLFATLELFITAALAALIIGIALCYFSEYQKKVINRIIIGFVSLMRAIPFLSPLIFCITDCRSSVLAWSRGPPVYWP